ncbi:MAG: ribonuclease III [Candidatus Margulisiibacteriota bacterium]
MMDEARIEKLKALEARLGVLFNNKDLLNQALTHSSYAFENNHQYPDNERLEFFGDAVLKLTISEHLFERFPFGEEGELTKMRAMIVSDAMLAQRAACLELGEYMLFGVNEQRGGGATRDSNLANALEAVFGAYYLDQKNTTAVNSFIVTILADTIEDAISPTTIVDAKSALQEYAQKLGEELPVYTVVEEIGPDHDKIFLIKAVLTIKDQPWEDTAEGKTKKEAEQAAARKILEAMEQEKCI